MERILSDYAWRIRLVSIQKTNERIDVIPSQDLEGGAFFKTPPQFFPRFLFALRRDPVAVYDDCATEVIYRSPARMRTEPSGSVSPSRYFCRAFSSVA